jgi:hypothetical protein
MFYTQWENMCANHSLILCEYGSFAPLFPVNLVGLSEVPDKHVLHFYGKLVTQNRQG